MRLKRVTPVQVGAHPRHHAHAAFLGGGHALAKKIAPVQEFSMAVELYLRRIKREDAGDADENNVGLAAMPIVGPLLDVHYGGVVFGHVALTHAAHPLQPGVGGGIEGRKTSRKRRELWCWVGRSFFRSGGERGLQSVKRGSQGKSGCAGGQTGLEECATVEHRLSPFSIAKVRSIFRRSAPFLWR